MSRRIHALVLITVLVVGALISVPASAAVFKIELTNGETLETRYRPRQSTQDENKILLITKHGNWISLPKDVIESVSSDFESKGYGTVLSTTTIVLGWSPNDAPVPEGEAEGMDPTERLLQYYQQRDSALAAPPPPFSVEQFAEPNSGGGIPLGYTRVTTPPMGSAGNEPPVAR
jgi:hypothetical protein